MNARSTKLKLESLDSRIVPSTVAYGDLNNDGLMDKAAITAARTVTVSLANPNGSFTTVATLTSSNGPSLQNIGMYDNNGDGNLDVIASNSTATSINTTIWLGHGDGTFGAPTTTRWKIPKWYV